MSFVVCEWLLGISGKVSSPKPIHFLIYCKCHHSIVRCDYQTLQATVPSSDSVTMNSRAANNNFQDTMNGRRSSSGSSMSLNPEATEFSCRQPESNRYLVAPSGPSRGGRGKGRGQPGNFPLPHIPPRPGRQGQHQHHQQPPFPKMHDMRPQFPSPPAFGPGQGYQPMFSVLPPPPIPNCMEMPAMPYPPPLPAGFPTQHEGYMGEHQSPGHHVSIRLSHA